MSPAIKERIAQAFPMILAAVVPLAGIVLALLRASEQRYREAGLIVAAALVGAAIWAIILTS